jgi:hypothetical protein
VLKEALQLFFKDNNKWSFSKFSEDRKWPLRRPHLADIYRHLNTLNFSMKGPKESTLTSTDKLLTFKKKFRYGKTPLKWKY